VDIRVKLVSVLPDCELLVVVNRDVDLASTVRFIIRVVELGHIRVSKGLFGGQSFIWVELEQAFHQIKSIIAGCREHVSKSLVFCWW